MTVTQMPGMIRTALNLRRKLQRLSASALQLVNSFLDQLLFNVLQVSKSTALSALRPAVIEVLKPKLGKDAVSNADEELREYLGGANEEDYGQFQGSSLSRSWDGELAWKRTRLRCMVYSSLGDMEEEDEDAYMEEENLDIGGARTNLRYHLSPSGNLPYFCHRVYGRTDPDSCRASRIPTSSIKD
ncbi:hypothetical protein J3459_017220 [Metarhizium acridum]|nr:hypothetical protein J3459_017220 [Metarhizium acridum]